MTDSNALEAAAKAELIELWCDLDNAMEYAHSGNWSLRCDALETRIKRLAAVIGATPWNHVPIPLIERGVYQRIHKELGLPVVIDMDKVAAHREYLDRTARL